MKIEQRRLGTRSRVMLNRTEARQAGLSALSRMGRLEGESPSARVTQIYVGGPGRESRKLSPEEFETACRAAILGEVEVPAGASFRVGLDEDGSVAGATFQWYHTAQEA